MIEVFIAFWKNGMERLDIPIRPDGRLLNIAVIVKKMQVLRTRRVY